ncbi:MAG: PilC/PilY family type IV pilus protein, partial [Pseudomonadota bacterium]
ASPALKNFSWAALSPAEQEWFSKKCTGATQLSQCTSALNDVQRGLIENGEVMLNYLRGQQEMQTTLDTLNNPLMRVRDHTLGDVVNAKATYVRDSRRAYLDAGYAAFRVTQASRAASLYVAANDGMLHAFKADAENDAGTELWAYVPRQVMPDLWQLADNAYGLHHRYFVDGSPTIGDVALDGVWKTILVAGLNKGGRGFYALDVTDPNRPQALWEFCAEAERCALQDDNLGYSYADPIITKRPSDGKWVVLVTSGYNNNVVPGNNAATGDGKGYLYVLDANTGRLLEKISTDVGDTTTPSGLSKISAWVENAQTDNTTLRVYGGDYLGNLWRFDLPREVGSTITVKRLARLTDPSNLAQPITSAPELGRCESKDMVYIGSGSYLGDSDVSNAQTQTIYAIKDTGTELGVLRPDSNAAASSGDMLQRTLTPFVGSDGRATGELIISNNSTDLDLATRRGWFMDLDQHREGLDEQTGQTIDLPGERVNMLSLPVQLVRNTLVAVTNQPAAAVNACQIGGVSYQYNISACTGGAVNGVLHGVVGTKLADAIVVGSLIVMLPSGKFKLISTLAGGTQKTTDVPIDSGGARRVSWRELTQ